MTADIGLVSRIKQQDNRIYSSICIWHNLNLILKHLIKWVEKHEITYIYSMITFVNEIASYFNYSYTLTADYQDFSKEFLKNSVNDNYDYKKYSFPKISRYCNTRFLSLHHSLKRIIIQWECLMKFFNHQLK